MKSKKQKKLILILTGLLLLHLAWEFVVPLGISPAVKVVDIPLHSGAIRIGYMLRKEGVIRSSFYFRLLCKVTGSQSKLHAGEYEFSGWSNLIHVWSTIKEGKIKVHYLTVPEGFSSLQIAEQLEQEGLASKADFLKTVGSREFCRKNNIPLNSAEGFLFPNSYELVKGMKAEEIAGTMVRQFFKVVSQEDIKKAAAMNLTLGQWVTLASIVEKEAEAKEERPIVAAVFLNRLKSRIRLESCATVLYALGIVKARLSLNDLNVASPYNTYRHSGLPPGPICNPGLPCLQAVLSPANVHYLFFVSKGDGTHAFSETLEQHDKAKRKYRQRF